jgi:hypothetical protein
MVFMLWRNFNNIPYYSVSGKQYFMLQNDLMDTKEITVM